MWLCMCVSSAQLLAIASVPIFALHRINSYFRDEIKCIRMAALAYHSPDHTKRLTDTAAQTRGQCDVRDGNEDSRLSRTLAFDVWFLVSLTVLLPPLLPFAQLSPICQLWCICGACVKYILSNSLCRINIIILRQCNNTSEWRALVTVCRALSISRHVYPTVIW